MQRTTSVTVGLLFALGVVFALAMGRKSSGSAHTASSPTAIEPKTPVPVVPPAPSAPAEREGPAPRSVANNRFDTLPDGRSVPELPDSAPKSIGFGAVLITYQGAQSAPENARSKSEAHAIALKLMDEAKINFDRAAAQGDPGSGANLGRIPRGILEPAPEYLLFSLEKGSVYPEPIDTPRGYWIVRRNQ